MNPLKIVFEPKSLSSFLVVTGVIFKAMAGLFLGVSPEQSIYFSDLGDTILRIGLIAWACFFVPAFVRNVRKL